MKKVILLKIIRAAYFKAFKVKSRPLPDCETNSDAASEMIYQLLVSDEPCMIARFGSTELSTMVNYIGIKNGEKSIFKYITGQSQAWWWNEGMIEQMQNWSGFFPPTKEKVAQFCDLMLKEIPEVDILGSWLSDESYFKEVKIIPKIHLRLLEPFWAQEPWTRALKDKKVLVIHPFADSILKQYANRENLFTNPDILPQFSSLEVIQAVQTLGKGDSRYNDWFEALDSMKAQIDKKDFDICLIGAGAYGFPLASYVKRIGKKSVHLGGALQLLFGIKGKRWEDPNYGVQEWGIPYGSYVSLMNEHWVRPKLNETPQSANAVEGACYW